MPARRSLALLVAAVLLLALPLPAQSYDTVQVRTERLAEGVYVLFGAGGNIGLSVGPDGAFVVDDQFAPLTPKILAAIGQVSDRPVRFVLNTHWHFDHTGGNENMGKAGALIVAHDNVRRRMSTAQVMELVNRRLDVPASPPGALPVITFSESATFYVNGDSLAVTHVAPAHTDGDAVVHFRRANVVHMGDVFVRGGYPFVDVSSGGTLSGIISAVSRVLERIDDGTKVIPGHGPVSSRADMQRYRDVLVAIRDRVRRQVAAGATLERVLASKPTAEFDAEWGKGFVTPDAFVRAAFADARRGRVGGAGTRPR